MSSLLTIGSLQLYRWTELQHFTLANRQLQTKRAYDHRLGKGKKISIVTIIPNILIFRTDLQSAYCFVAYTLFPIDAVCCL